MSAKNLCKDFICKIFLFTFLILFLIPSESFARDKTHTSNNDQVEYSEYDYAEESQENKKRKGQVDHITNKLLLDLQALENEPEQDDQTTLVPATTNDAASRADSHEASEININNADSHNPEMIESIGRGNLRTMPYAEIIVLNKITTKSEKIIFKVGEVKFFNNISVEVNKCVNNPSSLDPNNMMLITVFDNKIVTDKLSVFHGWMLSNNLSISSLEHPVYALIPQKCMDKKN